MSMNRQRFEADYDIFVGTEKTITLTVLDPDTGGGVVMTNTALYSTGNFKIVKPDGSIISTLPITYFDRNNGVINVTILDTVTVLANAGNWVGDLELINSTGKKIDQQLVGINILESY
jgi:hypothetical protein